MPNILTSTLIYNKIKEILQDIEDPSNPPEGIYENNGNNLFDIKLSFFTSDDPNWKLDTSVFELETFNILQDFESNIGDIIDCHIRLKPIDAFQLVNKYKNLQCRLVLTHYDINTLEPDPNMLPVMKTYRVFIKNFGNVLQSVNIKKYIYTQDDSTIEHIPYLREHAESTLLLELQLIPTKLYELQKKFVVCILNNTTVDDGIKYITKHFGIDKLDYIPSTNKNIVRHFIIPPHMSKFDVIYNYIQRTYGVYEYGLNYYFTNDEILYIYPLNNLYRTPPELIHIITTEPNKLIGVNRLYKIADDYRNFYIINSVESLLYNAYYQGLESDGTTGIIYRADRNIDCIDNTSKDNLQIPEDNVKVLDTNAHSLIKDKSFTPKIPNPSINMLNLSSDLASYQFQYLTVKLPLFFPFTQQENNPYSIKPGSCIRYYYDDNGTLMVKYGLVTYVEYQFTRTQMTYGSFLFVCSANMLCKLEVDNHVVSNDQFEEYNES